VKIIDDVEWQNSQESAYSYYLYPPGDTAYNGIYGKLYNYYAVVNSKGLCPTGWHIPTEQDWTNLELYLGMDISEISADGYRGNVGGKLKKNSPLWFGTNDPNQESWNETRFSGLPGGSRPGGGSGFPMELEGVWWCFPEGSNLDYSLRGLHSQQFGIARYRLGSYYWLGGSVRCIKDQ
jgi:uncharacterized protein (TIGR02145 family)